MDLRSRPSLCKASKPSVSGADVLFQRGRRCERGGLARLFAELLGFVRLTRVVLHNPTSPLITKRKRPPHTVCRCRQPPRNSHGGHSHYSILLLTSSAGTTELVRHPFIEFVYSPRPFDSPYRCSILCPYVAVSTSKEWQRWRNRIRRRS